MERADATRTKRENTGDIRAVPEFRRFLKRNGMTFEEFERQQDKRALGRGDLAELELRRRRLRLKKR